MNICKQSNRLSILFLFMSFCALEALSQTASPPPGGNQRSKVSQWMGLVEISVTYNSPSVTSKSGVNRRGEIWGKLVPYGMSQERWLEGDRQMTIPKPWRAGANENTVLSVSHDVLVEGKPLKAGSYGVFFIPGEKEWQLILSNDWHNWGHYAYDEKNDALRAPITPETSPYHEWLTYAFTEKSSDRVTMALNWEELSLPVRITLPDVHKVYIDKIKEELSSRKLMYWYNWNEAARYCVDNNVELELALQWIDKAINQTWVGRANFTTLRTKADVLYALNRKKEADSTMETAIRHAAGAFELHNYGRELLHKDKVDEAMRIFKLNASRHPDLWVTQLGMARAYGAKGDYKTALKHANAAKKMIPQHETGLRHFSVDNVINQLKNNQRPGVYLAGGMEQDY